MSNAQLEKRLTALEQEVARLKAGIGEKSRDKLPWWERIRGAFANDPAFDEAMRLGRQYRRQSGKRPKPRAAR